MKKANSKNNGHSNNGNGNDFVATLEPANGNGNGKKKAEYKVPEFPVEEKSKPKENVKVDENFNETIKITPHFSVLTTKGVEIYTNMNNLENAKLYIDGLAMTIQDDGEMVGLLMIFDAIKRKLNDEDTDNYLGAEDYINWLQSYIFNWSSTSSTCVNAYIEAVRSGNFVVGEMPENDSEVWAEGIYPPTYRGKAKDAALRAEIDALAETVRELQSQISERSSALETKIAQETSMFGSKSEHAKPMADYVHKNDLAGLVHALINNDDIPSRFLNTLYDSLNDMAGEILTVEVSRETIREALLRESVRGLQIKRQTAELEPHADTDDTQFTKLANSLSEILENPKTPDDLFNAVVGQLDLICGNELSKKLKDPEVIKQGLIHDQQQSEPENVTA